MQWVKRCKFQISNVPESISLGSICSLFGQLDQLDEFGVQKVSSPVYVISMSSSNIVEIEGQCDAIAQNSEFTMTWIESQRQVAVIGSDVDEPMSKLTSPPRKKRRVTTSPQQSPPMQSYKFIISDVPKNTSYFDVYSAFSPVGQINTFTPMYSRRILSKFDQYVCYTYNISIQTTSIDQLMLRCVRVSKQFNLKIERLVLCEVQSPEVENGQNGDQSMRLAPPDRQSSHNILNALNDHCLREIFERPEIDLNDLAAIANTCKRFNPIAEQAFAKKYVDDFTKFKHTHLWRVEELLRTFGEQITSIDFDDENDDDRLDIMVRMILKYCINVTKLKCSVFHDHSRRALRYVLPNLQELIIMRANEHIIDIFDETMDHQLKKLRFVKIMEQLNLPSIKLPQLIDLCLDNNAHFTIPSFEFFAMNQQIEVLTIKDNGIGGCRSIPILDYLTNVKVLEMGDQLFFYRQESLATLTNLKCLKRLCLHIHQFDHLEQTALRILQALHNGNINLESLSLKNWYQWNELLIDPICQFKDIKSLKIENKSNHRTGQDVVLSRVVCDLTKLESIHGENMATLNEIRGALKTAPQLKKAYFLVEVVLEDSAIIPDLELIEINAIRQEKGIDLCIDINIRDKIFMDNGAKEKILQDLEHQYSMFQSWVTFKI